ncbi:MAG: helix-turn-helix transcriptional regulator [Acidimicrobiaceae bacterium]|nr:helix-turn-helix transcriptional regulator [Acidimicrobiaceae bacterium]MBO0747626.1 helix-turn-helix transcriptional regulator [Acidimicrobiaceae bacterium]
MAAYWTYSPAGYLIRWARREAGMTQRQLAEVAGVPHGRVSDYERGKTDPSFAMLLRLLSAADKSLKLVDVEEGDVIIPEYNGRVLADVLSFADDLSKSGILTE